MNDALFTSGNWRPIAQRTEPLPNCDLLVRVLLVRHRREPGRFALLTEALRRGDGRDEMRSEGGTALTLDGVEPARCRQLFDEAVAALMPWEENQDG